MIRYFFISYVYKTENETFYGDFTVEQEGFPARKHLKQYVMFQRDFIESDGHFTITSILELSKVDFDKF